jgi:hypothetical protein
MACLAPPIIGQRPLKLFHLRSEDETLRPMKSPIPADWFRRTLLFAQIEQRRATTEA